MEEKNRNSSGGSKLLTSEQLQKLQDLQQRRRQIQKAQDERSKRKKTKKKGEKGGSERPGSRSGEQMSTPKQNAPDSAPNQGLGQRLRDEIDCHSLTPSKDLTVSLADVHSEGSPLVGGKILDTNARGASGGDAAVQQALTVTGGSGSGGSATSARRKRKKLYWGLDSKERWERKSNM